MKSVIYKDQEQTTTKKKIKYIYRLRIRKVANFLMYDEWQWGNINKSNEV